METSVGIKGGGGAARIARRAFLLGPPSLLAGGLSGAFSQPLDHIKIITTAGAPVVGQLMKNKGFLPAFGLDAEITQVTDGSKALGALLSGYSDIAVGTGFGQVLAAIEKGARVKIVAGAAIPNDAAIYSARADIKSCADLDGKTVGVGALGSTLHQIVLAILRKKNVNASRIKFVNVGSFGNVFRAVAAGVVDAGPGPADVLDQLDKYKIHALSDGLLWRELPDYTNQATYVTEKVLAEKRAIVVRALAAYAALYRFIMFEDSFNDFSAARAEAMSRNDRDAALFQWKFYRENKMFASDLELPEARARFMQQLNIDSGVQGKFIPYERVVDMSLANESLLLLNK